MAMASASPLFPGPATRRALERFQLAGQHVVDHPLRAANPSRRRGDGIEFRQFRPYQQGDDVRRIDWRLYARSDRLYVRESDQDSRLSVVFAVDTSASMGLTDADGQARLHCARRYVAALGWLAMRRQQDFSLYSLSDRPTQLLEAGSGRVHYQRLLARLADLKSDGQWQTAALERSLRLFPDRSLVVVISDFFAEADEQRAALRTLLQHAHIAYGLQIVLPTEMDWSMRGQSDVIDVETGERIRVDGRVYRQQYRQQMRRLLDDIASQNLGMGVRFCRVQTDTDLQDGLTALLRPDMPAQRRLLAEVVST
ncbi:MAG: DUF58 domain-containing protein [Pseudomonadota bacterium]